MVRLLIRLLGPFEATLDGEPAAGFHSDKVRALLAYLSIEGGRPLRRETLAGLLWPDLPEASARTNLRHAVANLRHVLGEPSRSDGAARGAPFMDVTRQTVQFNTGSDVWVDASAFLAVVEAEQRSLTLLEETVALYRGEVLKGFSLPDSALFEEWLLLQRERFQRLALDALHALAEGYALRGEYERALDYAWRQVDLDPFRETAHRLLMRLLAYSGRTTEALSHYETCRRLLYEELGTEPLAETTRLVERIRDGTLSIPPSPSVHMPAFLHGEPPAVVEKPVFVAREPELLRLRGFLRLALSGRGQVALVTGEAGSGKTALLRAFCNGSIETHPALLVTTGKGSAYTGAGDPYLPFRHAFGMLTGDVEGPWLAGAIDTSQALCLWHALPAAVAALVESGPELIGTFVPDQPLLDRIRAFLRGSGDIPRGQVSTVEALVTREVAPPGTHHPQQRKLFEQLTRVLHRLATPGGLLLVLDDFQWADAGSIDLLFHLGRRLAGSRILIVVAYRPEEVALARAGARHPLVPVLLELQREFGDVEVNLDQAGGRQFLEAFLDSEPNRLGPAFRDSLHEQTAGHPLFTIELLRAMQARGDLLQDQAGRWVEGTTLDWKTLPARTEAVIAERIGRLEPPLQEVLRVASVAGE
ncbi:MAG: BTAD domain-containing putative transcriptional regulator, partial [Anaerolineae bacterium]